MATTTEQIAEWFDQGIKDGAKHMLVVCDTFDWTDYPVYTTTDEDCLARFRNPGSMQKVMEVYDLGMDKREQINDGLVWHLPASGD